jgi:uncharacterized Zn finger protein (UPF0148 family)
MGEYPYPFFDKKGKVICQVCGKSFLVISPPHLKTHNLIYSDYTTRFPEAPLSNKEFVARGKYGKTKGLLPQSEEPAVEELTTTLEEDPEVEELEDLFKSEKKLDKIQSMKSRILDQLRIYFSNIRQDYLIMQNDQVGNFIFEFITDYCDPILKVVIQFPDTFWHNRELFVDPNKNYKLKQYGWKVIEIPSAGPTYEQIDEIINEA